MKRFFIVWMVVMAVGMGVVFADYTSPYDESFALLDQRNISLLTNALESRDYNLVYSAIKRLGQLRVTNVRPRIQVWFRESNPASAVGNDYEQVAMRNVFNISVWALGKIGDNHDAGVLAFYYDKITDAETKAIMIDALGDLSSSEEALNALHTIAMTVTDQRLAERVVRAIMKHNKKASSEVLLNMANRGGIFGTEFRSWVKENAMQLLTSGR